MNSIELDYKTRCFFNTYAQHLDKENFSQWLTLFEPSACTYQVLSKENKDLGLALPIMGCTTFGMIQDRVAMLAKGVLTYRRSSLLRQISNVQTHQDEAHRIHASANLVIYQSSEEGVSSLYMVARYEAILSEVQETLKIQSMSVIVESFGIDTMLAVPL